MAFNVDADGFVTGFDFERRPYVELQHAPLSYSLAKRVLQCPEDAWRITQKRDVEREESDAMDGGNVLDALLTAVTPWNETDCPVKEWSANTKKVTEPVQYSDWNGLRILSVESMQTKAAKECAADARANDMTPVLSHRFVREVKQAEDMLVRMELAGFDRSKYRFQCCAYWTEAARDGQRVQCRGRLDFVALDWTSIVDLKRVEDLTPIALERAVDRYKWSVQAAAYSRAVMLLRNDGVVPTWHWLFARTSPVVACTLRPAEAALLQAGEAAWNRAVNDWAEGLATGMWRGHESDHTPLNPTSWALDQMEVDLV
jgi:hypothetical protein